MTADRERHLLGEAIDSLGPPMKAWTVMAENRDPFRMDTEANHRDCQWLSDKWAECGISRPSYDRGLHYGLLGVTKPKMKGRPANTPYRNTWPDWSWLKGVVNKARWLDYIDWDDITDERNGEPIMRPWDEMDDPEGVVHHEEVEDAVALLKALVLPGAEGLLGVPTIWDFAAPQAYHIILFGEKTGLMGILGPLAEQFDASLFLAKGDLSNPLVHKAAETIARDGRPVVILYFADSDMSGWNMPISLSRKLAAMKLVKFPTLDFRVYRVGLRPDQVKLMDLPQEPLKPKDKRGPRWELATGTKATEIDALITQRPEVLQQMALDAIGQFYDATLDARVRTAERGWAQQVRTMIDERDDLAAIRVSAADRLFEIEGEISDLADEIEALSRGDRGRRAARDPRAARGRDRRGRPAGAAVQLVLDLRGADRGAGRVEELPAMKRSTPTDLRVPTGIWETGRKPTDTTGRR